jgi:ubiquinone biosynthesis monooxygenase Coq7
MLCTASVEEVIDKHYLEQIDYLNKNEKKEKDLLAKVKKFRQDELDHRDIAYEEGASKEGAYGLLDVIIKTGSKVAIEISKKI